MQIVSQEITIVWYFMQIISQGDNLHKMSKLIFGKNKKNVISLPSADFTQTAVKVKLKLFKNSTVIQYPLVVCFTGSTNKSK